MAESASNKSGSIQHAILTFGRVAVRQREILREMFTGSTSPADGELEQHKYSQWQNQWFVPL